MARESNDRASAYFEERETNIKRNNERIKSLGLHALVGEVNKLHPTIPGSKQMKKRSLEQTIPESNRVFRSQSGVRHGSDVEGDAETMHAEEENEELGLEKERNGRKRTRMHSVFDRANRPPVPVSFNEKGQPCGNNSSEFNNFIATLVKSHIPLGHADWRQVNIEAKIKFMTILRQYYVVDDKLKDYVMGSAAKKWRDFKADLKEKYFEDELTDEELSVLRDERVSIDDWDWLIKFWRSEEAKKRSLQGKQNRQKQKVFHTSGSKSYARVTAEMEKENGFAPRRDEVFIRTHESKIGKPLTKETAKVIEQIETAMDENPELLEKTIEQGDILAHVLGKERNGYVRGIGLGPSAGTLRMPGAQKLKSTKLQMAELEAKQAWQANELLREEVDDMRVDTKAQIDVLLEEVKLLRGMVVQSNAGNNKSSMHHIDTEPADSVGESAAANEQYSFHDVNIDEEDIMEQELREAQEQFERKKAEEALLRKKKEAARIQNRDAAQRQKEQQELLQKRKEAEILQKKRKESELRQNEEELQNKEAELKKKEAELQKKKKAAEVQKKKEAEAQKKKQQAAITQENHQQGSEVILYSVFRDHDTAVAKGTILSTDRKKMVGGWELGVECCEVVINYIIKGDAILFRPVGNMKKMGQAQGRSIAWLYKHLEVEQKSKAKAASLPQVD